MEHYRDKLKTQLNICRNIIVKGYTSIQNTRIPWLDTFCSEFLKFSEYLHTVLALFHEKEAPGANDQEEIIFLCLTQIVTCVKHMERTIKAEDFHGKAISASRQHFLDRIHWCLDRLRTCLKSLTSNCAKKISALEESTFVELMDMVLDLLSPYSSYKDEPLDDLSKDCINVAENRAQAMFASKQIRSIVDLVLSHTLAFANVALEQDKKALSALCQKVLRECISFQDECAAGISPDAPLNDSHRKLKAISLENALYRLEDYINEALLRLVYTSFLDFKKISIEKLREAIQECDADDPKLDEFIADFDVNVDRTTQIGIFAIAFAPNVKNKIILRSCLASFESLDSCIIPSLQSKGTSDVYAKLLEEHFNEEVTKFKQAIQEIIDSHAFASSFYEILTQAIKDNEKEYKKDKLEDIITMGDFLYEHFQIPVNQRELEKQATRKELYKKLTFMLEECRAVLKCSDIEVEPHRVLKRFKILRSILHKLMDDLSTGSRDDQGLLNGSQDFIMSEDLSDSQLMFASNGISPSIRSILYNNNTQMECRRQQRLANVSLKANYSKLPLTSMLATNPNDNIKMPQNELPHNKYIARPQKQRSSIRRKESLRTAMFKRQKSTETEHVYNIYRTNSASLQISEILDQLTGSSSDFDIRTLDKGIILN